MSLLVIKQRELEPAANTDEIVVVQPFQITVPEFSPEQLPPSPGPGLCPAQNKSPLLSAVDSGQGMRGWLPPLTARVTPTLEREFFQLRSVLF